LQKKYFNVLTPADTRRVAYHWQFKGKEYKPNLAVDKMSDHTLYVWHANFGYAGTLHDIFIWNNSFLLHSIFDGSFEQLDFPFLINCEEFEKLWIKYAMDAILMRHRSMLGLHFSMSIC
jgi:hypothetical protein